MNKFVIPSILTATVVVAGMFAFMPVEKASTVHQGLQSTSDRLVRLTATGVTPATAATDTATWTINQDFVILGIFATNSVDAGAQNNLAASFIDTNLVDTSGIPEPNPPSVPVGQEAGLIVANESGFYFGSTTLSVRLADEGGTHAATDAWNLEVMVLTRGDVTSPIAATLS